MSELTNRLAALRRQTGSEPRPGSPAAEVESFSATLRERIQRNGLKQRAITPSPTGDTELADRLGGELVKEGLIVIDETRPFGHRHGRTRIAPETLQAPSSFGHHGPAVFMDTETTGLAGGTGTTVFLLGLARLSEGGLEVRQLFMTRFSGEAALLEHARRFVSDASTLVTYNGKSFDAPLLATRYRLSALPNPFTGLSHLDLIHPTRTAYARLWPDCRLQTAERRLMDFHRATDLPGAEAPDTWFSWVRRGEHHRLPALLEHNRYDVITLAALVNALADVFRRPGDHPCDIAAIARHHYRLGQADRALGILEGHRERLDSRGLLQLAGYARQRNRWDLATRIWSKLAAEGHVLAIEHLAKYHEHVRQDPVEALRLTRRLRSLAACEPSHLRREQRLLKKAEQRLVS